MEEQMEIEQMKMDMKIVRNKQVRKSVVIQLSNLKYRAMQITIDYCKISTLYAVHFSVIRGRQKKKKKNIKDF